MSAAILHFGELGVIKGLNRTMTARAQPGSRLFQMKAENFREILEEFPNVREYFEKYVRILEEQDRWRQRSANRQKQ